MNLINIVFQQRLFQKLSKSLLVIVVIFSSSISAAQTAQEFLQKGDLSFDAYQLQKAERNYLLAIRRDPRLLEAYQGLIRVYLAQKRYEEGVRIADKAIKTNNTNAELWVSKGLLLREAGDIQKSNESYMQAVKRAQNNTAVLRLAEDHFYSVGNQMLAREVGIQRKQIEAGAKQ